jgi:hypothetical protein
MKLIKNISPMGIKINLSVLKIDGQSITVELNHGESILVDNIGIETKSIIIQKKKGNIDISDNFISGMIPYQKYTSEPIVEPIVEFVVEPIVEVVSPTEEHLKNEPTSFEDVTTESESVIIDSPIDQPTNKGGRPKGSNRKPLTKAQLRKKSRDRYKAKKNKKEDNKN